MQNQQPVVSNTNTITLELVDGKFYLVHQDVRTCLGSSEFVTEVFEKLEPTLERMHEAAERELFISMKAADTSYCRSE